MLKAFKMKLYEGMEAEYEKRHNALWPEMKDMIHEYGGKNYSIFLDKDTLILYAYIEIEDEAKCCVRFILVEEECLIAELETE